MFAGSCAVLARGCTGRFLASVPAGASPAARADHICLPGRAKMPPASINPPTAVLFVLYPRSVHPAGENVNGFAIPFPFSSPGRCPLCPPGLPSRSTESNPCPSASPPDPLGSMLIARGGSVLPTRSPSPSFKEDWREAQHLVGMGGSPATHGIDSWIFKARRDHYAPLS